MGQPDAVAEMSPAVAGKLCLPHAFRPGCPHLAHRHTGPKRGDQRGQRITQCTVDRVLLDGGLQSIGAADVAVVATDVNLYVELHRLTRSYRDRRGAVSHRNEPFDLPQRLEPAVTCRALPDGALIGCRHADGAQPRPQGIPRTGDTGLRQIGGQPQMRDLVEVLDRAQIVEDHSRLDPLDPG